MEIKVKDGLNMNKFYNDFMKCKTMEEIKQVYRKLAKLHHPDIGGNVEDMKQVNASYDYAVKNFLNNNRSDFKYNTEQKRQNEENTANIYKDIIDNIINIPDISIEICGNWIWVSGNSRPYKHILKKAGFNWASKKCQWYYKPADYVKKWHGKTLTKEEIREKYGSQKIK
jgi:hypothetical protein